MSSAKKNVVIFMMAGIPVLKPLELAKWCETALPSLNVVVATGVQDMISKGMKPDDVDGIVLWMVFRRYLEEFYAACSEKKRLRWVQCSFAGLDLTLCPVIVNDPAVTLCLATGVFSNQMAEWVIAGIMYWEKFIPRLQAQQKAHIWNRFQNQELRGKQMCVVGFGSIGQEAGRRATALGVHVVGVRRRPVPEDEETTTVSKDVAERVVGNDKLMDVLPTSDYVVLVLPLTDDSRQSFGRKQFDAMKSSAIFVNVGRGATVDQEALYEALRDHKIHAASLDVFDGEPLPPTSPMWDLENVLISPHNSASSPNSLDICAAFLKENLTRFAEDKPLLNIAAKKSGY